MSQTQITPVPVLNLKKVVRICCVALGAGLLLGTIGPFGTFENMDTTTRFGFWVGGILIGMIIHVPLFYGAAWVGNQYRVPAWAWISLSAVIAALPMTFVINGIFASMLGATNLDSMPRLYPFVLAISLPMQWLSYLTTDRVMLALPFVSGVPDLEVSGQLLSVPLVANAAPMSATSTKAPALAARLPARLGKAIILLEMEDHYVRVHTLLGDALIHMRMADAELELGGIDGMLVHRSYWVARSSITGWQRDGKTLLLQVSNGKSVPVARDRQPLVRAAGWLE